MPRPESRTTRTALVLAVTAAVVVIAAASTRLPPGATSEVRPVRTLTLDGLDSTIGLLMGVLVAGGLGLQLWLLATAKGSAPRQAPPRRSFAARCIILLAVLAAISLLFRRDDKPRETLLAPVAGLPAPAPAPDGSDGKTTRIPAGPPVVAGLAGLVAVTALVLSRRRVRPASRTLSAAVAGVVEATLDELRAEVDPRRAVIAAYAAMEAAMHAAGRPRRPSESPGELLGRLLAEVEVSRSSAERLTGLFEWARFGVGAVDEEMRVEAVAALEAVRAELARLVSA